MAENTNRVLSKTQLIEEACWKENHFKCSKKFELITYLFWQLIRELFPLSFCAFFRWKTISAAAIRAIFTSKFYI